MFIEMFGFLVGFILLLVIAAEFTPRKPALGVLAGMLLIMVGMMVFESGLWFHAGDVVEHDLVEVQNLSDPDLVVTTITGNLTTTQLSERIELPWVEFEPVLALLMVLLGLYAVVYYGVS